jgi:acyl dehydratase
LSNVKALTDELLETLRARIGTPISASRPQPYVTVATADAIRHWCFGIGDYNPLFLDEDYSQAGPHGGRIAPPSFLYACDKRVTGGVMGLPGVTGMFAGVNWEWRRPVVEGEHIVITSATVHDVIDREGEFAGRQFQVVSKIELGTTDGEVVATSYPYGFRQQRGEAARRTKYSAYQAPHYSPDDIDAMWSLAENEWRRGSTALDVESVRVGDPVGPMIRGPLTLSDFVVFLMGWGGQYIRSHGDWVRWARRHPSGALLNDFGVPDTIEAVHWDKDLAQTVGVPGPYDYGPQRASWGMTLVTNWMGDAARLLSYELTLRKHVLVGDAIWISGVVAGVAPDEGERGVISIDLQMRNQRDETVASGSASVAA